MTPAGRPNLPNEVKKCRGTLRDSRVPKFPLPALPMSELGVIDLPLKKEGNEFLTLAANSAFWISATTDRTLVYLTASQLDERSEIRVLLKDNPLDTKLRSALRDLEKAIAGNLSRLGFSPSDRARLGLSEIRAENKLEELQRRAQERRIRLAESP